MKVQKEIKITITLLVVFSLVALSFNFVHAQQAEPQHTWTCFGHDKRNTGLSEYETSDLDGTVKWTFNTDSYVRTNPVMNGNTIYIGTDGGKVYAINEDGSLKWSYEPEGYPNLDLTSTICVENDGKIYFGTGTFGDTYEFGENRLYALNQDGTLDWSYKADGSLVSSPVIDEDTLYIGSGNGTMYAFDILENELLWNYSTDGEIISSPAVDEDGNVYYGNTNGKIYSLNSEGGERWNYSLGSPVYSSPCIWDEQIYIGANDGYLYSLNEDGSLNWRFETGDKIRASPSVDEYGTIYVGSYDNYFYSISSEGEMNWKFEANEFITTSPAISGENTVYFGSEDNHVYALDSDGELKWKYETGNDIYSSPSIGRNGRVYVGSTDNKLYAFGPAEDDEIPFIGGVQFMVIIGILSCVYWWKKKE